MEKASTVFLAFETVKSNKILVRLLPVNTSQIHPSFQNFENEVATGVDLTKRFPSDKDTYDESMQFKGLTNPFRKKRATVTYQENYYEVETHVIVDTKLQEAITASSRFNLQEYLSIFFHTVNYIYEQSHDLDPSFPKIVFQIVKLTKLGQTEEVKIFAPAADQNDPDVIDNQNVLKTVKKMIKKEKFDKYDHHMVLTGRDLYRKKEGGDYFADVLGSAYLGGICKKSTDTEKTSKSVSVIEDIGALFQGVYTAVHEFAHNLGARHDKDPCYPQDGFIMSPETKETSNKFKFSECSLNSIKSMLESEQGSCLRKYSSKPILNVVKEKRFPGDVYSMQEVCDTLGEVTFPNEVFIQTEPNPNKTPEQLCRKVSCRVKLASHDHDLQIEVPYAPGERVDCDNGRGKCILGDCLYGY